MGTKRRMPGEKDIPVDDKVWIMAGWKMRDRKGLGEVVCRRHGLRRGLMHCGGRAIERLATKQARW